MDDREGILIAESMAEINCELREIKALISDFVRLFAGLVDMVEEERVKGKEG